MKVWPEMLLAMCKGFANTFTVLRTDGYGSSGEAQKGCVRGRESVMKDLQHQYGLPGEL